MVTLLCLALLLPVEWNATAQVARVEEAVELGDTAGLEDSRELLLARRAEQSDDTMVLYTLAYVDWRLSQLYPVRGVAKAVKKQNKKRHDMLLKEAEDLLKRLTKAEPEDAEAHALLGAVIGARIGGMWSGMRRGPKADKALKRALELDQDNPRAYLNEGIAAFFKPGSFGGGKDKSEAALRRALELFAEQPTAAPWPSWGHVDAWIWLGRAQAELGRSVEARAAYEAALELAPDHKWVKETLLPALDEPGVEVRSGR